MVKYHFLMMIQKKKKMETQVDQQAQYSRRNCLLFHGIKEEKGEDPGSIINIFKEEMDA